MSTLSFRLNEEDAKLVQAYAAANHIRLSELVREALLDRIEEDLKLDEARIATSRELLKEQKTYSHSDVWDILGV